MVIVAIVVAAVAGFAVGAIWYNVFSTQWMEDVGVQMKEDGTPDITQSPTLYAKGFVCTLVVAAMMAHTFSGSGVDTWHAGLIGGFGIGAFFIAPWITLNILYSMRPIRLAMIDGGYAAVACGVMGFVLTLF